MSWYTSCGKDGDTVLSSRVRLARNLSGYSFPHHMTEEKMIEVRDRAVSAIMSLPCAETEKFVTLNMDLLPDADRVALVEKHLISEDLAKGGPGHSVCISKDESVSIMVNEEDHIRIQVMDCGFSLDKAYRKAEEIAVFLENHLQIAYSEQYGFLTACPTNTGTGMRASVMVHLPALTTLGRMQALIDGLSQAGFAVRGYLGEHSQANGNVYQMSNQITLGISETNILLSFKRMVEEVLELERKLRSELYASNPHKIRDRVYRSYGELLYARMMTDVEAMKRISDLRLGIALGFFEENDEETLARLAAFIGPAGVQKDKGELLSIHEQEIHRAEMIRRMLSQKKSQ
ncbi:MAG: protein arginine kinase [Clostridiales bacterium]|nr:protein arginine kinase [Clostridiales bacterium]